MKLKVWLVFILVALELGCTSKSKNPEDQELPESPRSAKDREDDELLEGLNTEQQRSSPKEMETKYNKLSQALKAQSEVDLLKHAEAILFEDPDDVKTLNALALFYINRGKMGLAKRFVARALKKGSGVAAVQNNLGVILVAEGDQDNAIGAFKKALAADSGNVAASTNLGLIYAKYGAYAKALPLLERAHEANKQDSNIAKAYAVCLRGSGNAQDAADIYKGLVAGSDDIGMLMDYAEMLVYELKSESEARTVLNKIRFLDPSGEIVDRVIQMERQLK